MRRPANHETDSRAEARARASLSTRAGRPLTDEQWDRAKDAFLTLFRHLTSTSQDVSPSGSGIAPSHDEPQPEERRTCWPSRIPHSTHPPNGVALKTLAPTTIASNTNAPPHREEALLSLAIADSLE